VYLVDPVRCEEEKGPSEEQGKLTRGRPILGSAEEKIILAAKYDNKQRMIRELAANQLLQKELAKSDPSLVCVSAFKSRVCGTDKGATKLRETADSVIQEGLLRQEKVLAAISLSSSESVSALGNVIAPILKTGATDAVTQIAAAGFG